MKGKTRLFLRRLPFVFKTLFLTISVGFLVGLATDYYAGKTASSVFKNHLQGILDQQSQENRLRFEHYLKNFYNVAKLTVMHAPFLSYVKEKDWRDEGNVDFIIKNRLPPWLLKRSVLSNLAVPRFVLLLDERGVAREIYTREKREFLPKILMDLPPLLVARSKEQAYIYKAKQGPFALTAQDVDIEGTVKATLLLVSPIDEQFLTATQKDMPQRLVALVDANDDTLIASNNEKILPAGSSLEGLGENYVITGRKYHEYGGAEMAIRLSSFVSNQQIKELSKTFVTSERIQKGVSAAVYISLFVLITLWISRRIGILTGKVEEFSAQALGGDNPHLPSGDKLDILAERFQILTEEVLSSHRQIEEREREKAAQRLEVETKSRQLGLLESVMDSLGIGVLIMRSGKLEPINNKMVSYLGIVEDPSVFRVEKGICREQHVKDRDGRDFYFQLTGIALFGEEQVILVKDFTEEKTTWEEKRKLQADLFQAQKMESVGRLAGGIAHDFNNILTAILGYAQLGIIKCKNDQNLRTNFETIFESGKRAADMTQQLLAFSRKQIIETKPVSLNKVVEHLQKMLNRLIGEDIEVEVYLEEMLGEIEADQTQMEQLLMNLALNARDAMPQGGRLSIETKNIEIGSTLARKLGDIKTGKYVKLKVSDDGVGIKQGDLEHIFEPFYTTKEIGKGTGLGLAMVYGIVKQNKGSVYVKSEEGAGTTFELYFPVIKDYQRKEDSGKKAENLVGGTETVLLVEDDRNVRRLAGSVLRGSGYTVLEAENGEEAAAVVAGGDEQVDLLLTDVVMPGINGSELADRLAKKFPGLKILYMTGYTEDSKVLQKLAKEKINLLQKPLTPTAITDKVREVLDG